MTAVGEVAAATAARRVSASERRGEEGRDGGTGNRPARGTGGAGGGTSGGGGARPRPPADPLRGRAARDHVHGDAGRAGARLAVPHAPAAGVPASLPVVQHLGPGALPVLLAGGDSAVDRLAAGRQPWNDQRRPAAPLACERQLRFGGHRVPGRDGHGAGRRRRTRPDRPGAQRTAERRGADLRPPFREHGHSGPAQQSQRAVGPGRAERLRRGRAPAADRAAGRRGAGGSLGHAEPGAADRAAAGPHGRPRRGCPRTAAGAAEQPRERFWRLSA